MRFTREHLTSTGTETSALSRRRLLQLMGAAATVPVLGSVAGCESPGSTSDGGGGGGGGGDTLTFVYRGDANQQEAFNKLFAEFNKVEPDIKLRAQGIAADTWGDFSNTVATRIAGGQVPDIIQIATEGQRIFASKDLLEPLEPYMERDQDIVDDYFADIDPNLVEWNTKYASHDGQTYYIPGGYNTVCFWYNTETWAAAGAAPPTAGWTWDDFLVAAEQLKAAGVFILPIGSDPFTAIMPWMLTNGGSPLDEEWATPTFDTPQSIESLQFCRDLIANGYAPEPGGAFDAGEALSKGTLAAIAGGRWPVIDMRRLELVDKMAIVPMPQKTGPGSPVGWDAWPITKASEKKNAAWAFIKFMMSKEASEYYASIGGTIVPARLSVANSPAFTDDAPEGTTALSEAISYATPVPSPDRGAEVQTAMINAWDKALSGNESPEAALAQANEELAGLL
ncbi:ABC transporter substrate-binding protein [Jiangella alkaliphila]|uniref:Carbohydrate ABC transporter substrate-binding protein, CUT1 family n=1 Tax=Jiangella alkaliphila TaxID=419479 RepID=A0A1H2LBH8_9ACTN|nr:sugar ABC transporter substrate-binding protein [Jiangella alkaliphila]SDU77968.1 carbohydrate ABC transporter substrate-binding protein, CUT1 family [Jiangella alkaliphila]